MKSESYLEDYQFKFYQVQQLAADYKQYSKEKKTVKEQFKELEIILDEDIYPTMTYPDYDIGQILTRGVDVEKMVITRLAAKDILLKRIDWLKKKTDLFEIAVSELSHRERQVINILFFGEDYKTLGLSSSYFEEIQQEAVSKIYKYYSFARRQEQSQRELKRKESIKQKATALKEQMTKAV